MRAFSSWLQVRGGSGTLRYFVLLLGLSTLVRSPTLFMHNFNVDEAIYTSLATEMLDGALYFRDVVDHKPPGIYYVYAGVYAVAGRYNLVAIHLALFVTVALTGLLLAFVGQRLFASQAHGRLAGLLYVVLGACGTPMDFQAANAELFMNLPSLTALALYLRTRQRDGAWGYFGAGLCLALGALIKFQAGFLVAALLVHLLASRGKRLLPLALGLCGLALPFLAHAILYHALGAWEPLWWGLRFNSLYVSASDMAFQLRRAVERTALFAALSLPVSVPAVVYLARGRGTRGSPEREAWLLLVSWLLAGAAAVSVGGRYFLHYYLQLMPILALMGAGPLLRWSARQPLVGRALGALVAVGVACWIAVSLLDRQLRPAEAWHQERYQAVGRYLREHSRPDERIFVWGNSPTIYLYAQRRMGTRYLWVNYQTGRIWGTPYEAIDAPPPPRRLVATETWPLLLGDLQRNLPALIIDAGAGRLDEFDRHPLTRYPAVAAIVQQHYARETTILGVPIYRRRDRLAAPRKERQ